MSWNININAFSPKVSLQNSGLFVKGPKTKFAPSVAKARILIKNAEIKSKIFCPISTFKIKTASKNWSARPTVTVLIFIAFLLFDIKNAISKNAKIPKIPNKICMSEPLKISYAITIAWTKLL